MAAALLQAAASENKLQAWSIAPLLSVGMFDGTCTHFLDCISTVNFG